MCGLSIVICCSAIEPPQLVEQTIEVYCNEALENGRRVLIEWMVSRFIACCIASLFMLVITQILRICDNNKIFVGCVCRWVHRSQVWCIQEKMKLVLNWILEILPV